MKNKLLILIFFLFANVLLGSEVELGSEEKVELRSKWIDKNATTKESKLTLSLAEKKYLANKKVITMCVDPNWMPLEKIDKDGKYIGILSEYIKLFSSRLDVKFALQKTTTYKQSREYLKSGRCEIIVADVATKLVKEQFLVTKPYFIMPRAFAINSDTKGVQNFSQIALEGKIGVRLNAPTESILKNIYSDIEIVVFSDMPKGLNAVATKQIIAYVGAMSPMVYSIQSNGLLNVNIGGTVNTDKLSVLINKNSPQLVSILNKAIDNLSENDKIKILNKWVKVTYNKSVDYTLVWQIIIVFFILFLIGLFFTFLLRKSNKKLKKTQEQNVNLNNELHELNQSLESRVKKEIEKNLKQQRILSQQSRLAEMGEMLSSIAHQWRQPLNRINASVSALRSVLRRDTIDHERLMSETEMIEQNTKYMSDTIGDFSNFFHPDKTKTTFSVQNVINKALELIDQRTENVRVSIISDKKMEFFSFEKEYLQVVLILLNNAIDNFESKSIKEPKIDIIIKEHEGMATLVICDNGGGVDEGDINRIFDPYYTTKFANEGTGLGLYVAKMLIENSMHGKLQVENKNDGACFKIITSLKER